jgi:hypothetical protein
MSARADVFAEAQAYRLLPRFQTAADRLSVSTGGAGSEQAEIDGKTVNVPRQLQHRRVGTGRARKCA